jgi:hypothetical protein
MDLIFPWLDPAEVRSLATQLMMPDREIPTARGDAGFGENFVGFGPTLTPKAASQPPSTASPTPASPAPASTLLSFPETAEPAAPVVRAPFLGRINRFRDWMHQNFGASEIFILDREGLVIFDESHHGRLHFLARSLALASSRPGASTGNVHVKIGSDTTFEVIPVNTPYGWLVLGAIVPEALGQPAVTAVMRALIVVASPPKSQ